MSHSISGNVAGLNHNIATVNYSGDATGSTTTDTDGNYTISGLADGIYYLDVAYVNVNFNPGYAQITVNGADVTGVNFIIASPVSGVISSLDLVEGSGLIRFNADTEVWFSLKEWLGGGTSLLFALTSVTVNVGARTATYAGTITGGDGNAFAGQTFLFDGSGATGNNGEFVVTASSSTTLIVALTTQSNDTYSGSATTILPKVGTPVFFDFGEGGGSAINVTLGSLS